MSKDKKEGSDGPAETGPKEQVPSQQTEKKNMDATLEKTPAEQIAELPETAPELEVQGEEMTMESLLKEQDAFNEQLNKREIVTVTVVSVNADKVLVDIGSKKEGIIPLEEFPEDRPPRIGAKIPAILLRRGREEGSPMLSYRQARWKMGWQSIVDTYEKGERTKGRVTDVVKGGYLVDLGGVQAFLPMSLSELRQTYKPTLPKNAKVKLYIIELDAGKKRVVVSRKKVLEEDAKGRRDEAIQKVKAGMIVRGVVAHIKDFGVFIHLGGLEGLVNNEDIAWTDVEEAKKKIKRGARVRAKILKVDLEAGKVTLGLKQLLPNPADQLRRRFPIKSTVEVKILKAGPELTEAVILKGEVPAVLEPRDYVDETIPPTEGETMKAVVVGIDHVGFRVKVSAKKFEDIQDRKRVQQYMKKAPALTLGDLLQQAAEDKAAQDAEGDDA